MNLLRKSSLFVGALALSASLFSCVDDPGQVGSSLSRNEVTIIVDSIETRLSAATVEYDNFDARSDTKLLGRINVPEYGRLSSTFVSQIFCADQMNVADSITSADIDSIGVIFRCLRGAFTGDSLAPQQLKVYQLTRQLPADINNSFDPTGYFDPSAPLGSASYTLSAIAENDTVLKKGTYIDIPVKLPLELGVKAFETYRNNPDVFAWPKEFAKYFPGIYVEQNFGTGCLANISKFMVFDYYHHTEMKVQSVDGTTVKVPVTVRDSVALFSSAPEVLSSNNIKYEVSDNIKNLIAAGKTVVTTPGGYFAKIVFPAREIVNKYNSANSNMSVISNLSLRIPAKSVENSYGLDPAPFLLMVKASQLESFFSDKKVPDSLNSFYAAYSSANGCYDFSSMRDYIMDIINSGKEITDDDTDFVLMPVNMEVETQTNSYTGTVTSYVTGCTPYLLKPTMTLLETDRAVINFTYSQQVIK